MGLGKRHEPAAGVGGGMSWQQGWVWLGEGHEPAAGVGGLGLVKC